MTLKIGFSNIFALITYQSTTRARHTLLLVHEQDPITTRHVRCTPIPTCSRHDDLFIHRFSESVITNRTHMIPPLFSNYGVCDILKKLIHV
jgi:hypothetical protein